MTYVIFIINSETIIMIFVYQIRNLLFRYKKEKKKRKAEKIIYHYEDSFD